MIDAQTAKKRLADLQLEQLRRAEVKREARTDFLSFVKHTKPDYRANWHHVEIAKTLQLWADGEIKRLLITCPPRHGKSELVSRRLPAWIFANDRDAKIISCSYGQDLADDMSLDVQGIIGSERFKDLFRYTKVYDGKGQTKKARTRNWHVQHGQGYYKCAGVAGGLTGKGFSHGIIDDPFKNMQEALSANHREKIWQWFWSVFVTRKSPDASILLTLTRWHLDDLAGRLLREAEAEDGEAWTVIDLPAEMTDEPSASTLDIDHRKPGEYLWPDQFNKEELAPIKRITVVWRAAYQQRPLAKGGTVVKTGWFNRYDHLPQDGFAKLLLSVDCAFKKSDSGSDVCLQLWGQRHAPHGAHLYLLDEICEPLDYIGTEAALKLMVRRWQLKTCLKLVEEKANGAAIINRMSKQIPGIVAVNPKESKYARFLAVAPVYASGCVFVPAADYMVQGVRAADWAEVHIAQLTQFPNAAKDDRVDCASQALDYLAGAAFELLFGRADEYEDDEARDIEAPAVQQIKPSASSTVMTRSLGKLWL